jgi:hypothetical protein
MSAALTATKDRSKGGRPKSGAAYIDRNRTRSLLVMGDGEFVPPDLVIASATLAVVGPE